MHLKPTNEARFYFLFVAFLLLVFFNLGKSPLYVLDEVKNAQCAREMMERHDWIVPTFNGKLRTDKPPLHYYFMMIAYGLFGINAFAARFFSAIAGAASILVTWGFMKRYFPRSASLIACVIMACNTHLLLEFRLAVPDPYFIFFITAGLYCSFIWVKDREPKFLYIAALCFGLATLSKGPAGIVLPVICFLTWIAWRREWKKILSAHFLFASLLYFAITAPWFIAVHIATHGEWTYGFFWQQNVKRFLEPMEGHGGIFLLVPLYFLVGLLPFSAFILGMVRRGKGTLHSPASQFAFIVVLVFVIFFSLARTKLPNYAMPAYPFAAIIIAGFFEDARQYQRQPQIFYPVLILIVVVTAVIGYGLSMMRKEIHGENQWLTLLLLPTVLILIALLFAGNKAPLKLSLTIAVAWMFLDFVSLDIVYPSIFKRNPVAQTIDVVRKASKVYGFGIINPAYVFYLKEQVRITESPDTLQRWLLSDPGAAVITRASFEKQLQSLPLTTIAAGHNLFEHDTTVILRKLVP